MKYLGYYLTIHANPLATIQDRLQRGTGILSNMKALLEDIPLGSKRMEIGLTLRESWFINGTLFNSEVWCSYSKNNLKGLSILDRKILKLALGSHSKAHSEMIYLETGCLPLENVITARRLLYLQTILQRDENETIRRVYMEQKKNPCKGDWVTLIEADMKHLEIELTDETIASLGADVYKKIVMTKIREKALIELQIIQKRHLKVKHIVYKKLSEPQTYLCHGSFTNKLSSLLFNLRCKVVRGIKENFHRQFKSDLFCLFFA